MKERARVLHDRANELGRAEYRYSTLIRNLTDFFQVLGDSEFGKKLDREMLDRLERVLDQDICPQLQAVREEYVSLFGFSWSDRVRVENKEMPPIELVPTYMNFAPYSVEPFAWLHGLALKANGSPGKKVLFAKLYPGMTKVTVLS